MPIGAAVGIGTIGAGVYTAEKAEDAAYAASQQAIGATATQEDRNRALNIERYQEAQRLLTPYIGASNQALQQLQAELYGAPQQPQQQTYLPATETTTGYTPGAGGDIYLPGASERPAPSTTGYLPGAYAAEQKPIDDRRAATLEAVLAETPLPTRPTSYAQGGKYGGVAEFVRGGGQQRMMADYETELAAARTAADAEVQRRIAALPPEASPQEVAQVTEQVTAQAQAEVSSGLPTAPGYTRAYMGDPTTGVTGKAIEGEYIPAGTGITDFYGEAGEIAPGGAYRDPTQYMADISAGYEDFVANNPVYQKMLETGSQQALASGLASGQGTGSMLAALRDVGQGVEAQFFTNYMNTVGDITSMNEQRFNQYLGSGEQRNINEQNLLENRRINAENTEEQRYVNYMNTLQNLASPGTATNLASLGVNQGITQGQTSAQAIAAQSQYGLGAVSAANAARADVMGGIGNLATAYIGSQGTQPSYGLPQTTGTIYGGGSTPQPINYGGYA